MNLFIILKGDVRSPFYLSDINLVKIWFEEVGVIMSNLVDELVNLLDLESIEFNLFCGKSWDIGGYSVFGG